MKEDLLEIDELQRLSEQQTLAVLKESASIITFTGQT